MPTPGVTVQFRYAYRLRRRRTCCFSGIVSLDWFPVRAGDSLPIQALRPTAMVLRAGSRIRGSSPQHSDLVLGSGGVHPDMLLGVPNDIFQVLVAQEPAA